MHRQKGFTFIELLIALSLFTIGMVSVLQIFPVNRRYLSQSAMITQATFLAQEEVEQIRGTDYNSLAVDDIPYESRHVLSDVSGDPISQFERQTILTYVDPANYQESQTDQGLKKVEVTVFWQERSGARQYVLSTYVYHR